MVTGRSYPNSLAEEMLKAKGSHQHHPSDRAAEQAVDGASPESVASFAEMQDQARRADSAGVQLSRPRRLLSCLTRLIAAKA